MWWVRVTTGRTGVACLAPLSLWCLSESNNINPGAMCSLGPSSTHNLACLAFLVYSAEVGQGSGESGRQVLTPRLANEGCALVSRYSQPHAFRESVRVDKEQDGIRLVLLHLVPRSQPHYSQFVKLGKAVLLNLVNQGNLRHSSIAAAG
jgi:hypothetical protein